MADRLNRRQVVAALGSLSLGAVIAACGKDDATDSKAGRTTDTGATTPDRFDRAATCAVTPELTEGPFYFDVHSIRSDIREDRPGTPLDLALRVRSAGDCKPLKDVVVDLWHCDASGAYSGFESGSRGGDDTYLRGAQVTNGDGAVEFKTIYPGWYPGRTPHIHAKVHVDARSLLTTQLFFDDRTSADVYSRPPYSSRGERDTSNGDDGIFDESLVLTLSKERDGYRGLMTFDVRRA